MKTTLLLVALLFLFQADGSLYSAASRENSEDKKSEEDLVASIVSKEIGYRKDFGMLKNFFVKSCLDGKDDQVQKIIYLCKKHDQLLMALMNFSENGKSLEKFLLDRGLNGTLKMLQDALQKIEYFESDIMQAVEQNNVRKLKFYLKAEEDHERKSLSDETALHLASSMGNEEIVLILLGHLKSDLNNQNIYGQTALLIAASLGYKEIVHTLLKCGANPNIPNSDGISPLHCVIAFEHSDIFRELLRFNANLDAENREGWTPRNVYNGKRKSKIIAFVRK
ncbi:ankyrin repeat domain-containing protein [Candidatus Babeliales bacterium]|nr:ankyrin repeat domain-containing protein [Candidatus Babeliales bacterium]